MVNCKTDPNTLLNMSQIHKMMSFNKKDILSASIKPKSNNSFNFPENELLEKKFKLKLSIYSVRE